MDVGVVDNEHGAAANVAPQRRVLNAGSGRRSGRSLHSLFQHPSWREVRIDIDPDASPDIVGSITDMRADLLNGSFDAIWSSHSIEHLRTDEVPAAMAEFRRILRSDGFALITCPDLEAVASAIVNHGLDYVAYVSGVGPVTPLDMLFGHAKSIAVGQKHMAHQTGFTAERLSRLLLDAGFPTILAKTQMFDLWVLALMPRANQATLERQFRAACFHMFDEHF
jgi:SAM-dependent methyltransferase